jgi:hypothetical protein
MLASCNPKFKRKLSMYYLYIDAPERLYNFGSGLHFKPARPEEAWRSNLVVRSWLQINSCKIEQLCAEVVAAPHRGSFRALSPYLQKSRNGVALNCV